MREKGGGPTELSGCTPTMPGYPGGMIERFVPTAEVGSQHSVDVPTSPADTYEVIRTADLGGSRVVRMLFAVRGLPSRRPLTIETMERVGFVMLRQEPGRGLVLGVTGRFWTLRGDLRRIDAAEFAEFAEPGYAKGAWSFAIEPGPDGGSIVTTETRVTTTDEGSRRAFRRYWRLVGPFSSLIRRRLLAVIARECSSRNAEPGTGPQ